MEQIANASLLTEKWAPVLNHNETGEIKDNYRRNVTHSIAKRAEALRRACRGLLLPYLTPMPPNARLKTSGKEHE